MNAFRSLALLLILSTALPPVVSGQEGTDGVTHVPVSTADHSLDPSKLEWLLNPLTKDELAVEAEAWRDIVKAKVQSVSGRALEGTEDAEGEMAFLHDGKNAAIERFHIVLDAFETKGGDAGEFRAYATAVSGAEIDLTDAGATVGAFRSWLTSKEGGIKLGLQALKFLVVMIVAWLVARFVQRLLRKGAEISDTFSDLLEQFLIKLSFRLVMFLGLLVALATVGVNVGAILALIGGASFIVGFALQDTLGNFASGIMLLVYRPFDVGDSVEVAGVSGSIDQVSLVSTTIRTFDNKVVLVPNKKVWGEVITNSSASDKRRVDMTFGIGYDDDSDKAKAILEQIVAECEEVLDEPKTVIQMHELGDSSVNFICRPWVKTGDYWKVNWEVTQRVKAEFDKAGISLPYPQQDVHIHQVAG